MCGQQPRGFCRKLHLLLVSARHAGHALLLAPGKGPCGGLHQQAKQQLVVQLGRLSLQQLEDGGAQTEVQLGAKEEGEKMKKNPVFYRFCLPNW